MSWVIGCPPLKNLRLGFDSDRGVGIEDPYTDSTNSSRRGKTKILTISVNGFILESIQTLIQLTTHDSNKLKEHS